jgi:hypothetical protein
MQCVKTVKLLEQLTLNDMTDKEILDTVTGGQTIKEMTAITFFAWLADKMNGLSTYTAANQELSLAILNPPMSRVYPELEKIRLVRKLLDLGVTI